MLSFKITRLVNQRASTAQQLLTTAYSLPILENIYWANSHSKTLNTFNGYFSRQYFNLNSENFKYIKSFRQ